MYERRKDMTSIQALYVYPVKSARAIARSSVLVTASGFQWDRHWMVVDAQGRFLTQRTHPRLARVVPDIREDHLLLEAPGLPPLRTPLAPLGEPVPVRVWNHVGTATDTGAAAKEWISEVLGQEARLVRVAPGMDRVADRKYTQERVAPLNFPDGFPVLVCNQASLEAINARMPQPVPMERFRPNLVLTGLPAFAEDHIDELRIGELILRLVKPCTRCVIPSIDQHTGEPSTNPTPVLRELRFNPVLRGVTFGENAILTAGDGSVLLSGADCVVSFDDAARAP
jgi:uncharacterized protein YcbX